MKKNGSLIFGSAYQKAIELRGKNFLTKETLENKEYSDIKEKSRLIKTESITKEKSIEIAQKWLLNPYFEFRTESITGILKNVSLQRRNKLSNLRNISFTSNNVTPIF